MNTKKKTTLTPDEQKLMRVVRDEWTNRALSCQPLDEPACKAGIQWLYTELLDKPAPQVIIVDSWHGAVLCAATLKNKRDSVRASVGASVAASVWDSVRASVGASVAASVWDSVGASVWDSVRASVGASVRASVWDSVWDSVADSVGASVADSVADSVGNVFSGYSGYVNWSDFGWVSFYEYFTRIGVLNNSIFNAYRNLIWSNPFVCYLYEGIAIIARPPLYIHRNTGGRLHCTTGPAVEFRDGIKLYYINGREIPGELIEQPQTITRERFLNERNSDIRGAIYEILGQQKMFDLLGAEEVNRKQANNETYILYQTREADPDLGWLKWVGVQCPSTGTRYLLGVPPETVCPIEGVAGTFGLSASEYVLQQNT